MHTNRAPSNILVVLQHIGAAVLWTYPKRTAINSRGPTVFFDTVSCCLCRQQVCPGCTTWGRWEGQGPYNKFSNEKQAETHLWYVYLWKCTGWLYSHTTYCKMRNGLWNGLIPRTHRKWKYALISCRNDHFAHYRPLQRSRSLKLAVILKQPTISFWSLTVRVGCHCELLLSTCGDRVLGWSDLDFRTVQLKTDRPWTKS